MSAIPGLADRMRNEALRHADHDKYLLKRHQKNAILDLDDETVLALGPSGDIERLAAAWIRGSADIRIWHSYQQQLDRLLDQKAMNAWCKEIISVAVKRAAA